MYIGFTGALAFKMLKKPDVLLKLSLWTGFFLKRTAPIWRPPYRGQRCESPMIEEVAKVVAEIKKLDPQEVLDITNRNACHLFGIEYEKG